jgi:hypothetical protein
MRFEIIFEGPLREWPGPFGHPAGSPDPAYGRADASRLSRRHALQLAGGLVVTPAALALLPRQVRAQGGLLESAILSYSVTREVVPVDDLQEALTELANESSRRQDGLMMAEFKTNGIITDSGSEIVKIPAGGFITAKFTGDTGGSPGAGLTTGYTSLASKSASYQVR